MTIADWTPEELAANRRGEIAPSQIAKLRSGARSLALIIIVVMIVLLGGFSYLMFSYGTMGLHVTGAIFDAMVLGFGITAIVMGQQQLARDLSEHKVETVSGMVKLETKRSGRQKGTEQAVTVGGKELRSMFGGLDKLAGQTVTVFVLPHSQRVFALDRA